MQFFQLTKEQCNSFQWLHSNKPPLRLWQIFCYIICMTTKEFRLTSLEDPTDEMLEEILRGVEKDAIESSKRADKVIEEMWAQTERRIAEHHAKNN